MMLENHDAGKKLAMVFIKVLNLIKIFVYMHIYGLQSCCKALTDIDWQIKHQWLL